jgi:hypothetical protein
VYQNEKVVDGLLEEKKIEQQSVKRLQSELEEVIINMYLHMYISILK